MLIPGCEVCGEGGQFKSEWIACEKCAHAVPYVRELKDALYKAQSAESSLNYAARMMLRILAPKVTPTEQHLLDFVLECIGTYDEGGKKEFWTDSVIVSGLVCDASDVISTIGTEQFPNALALLRQNLNSYFDLHGWDKPKPKEGTNRCIEEYEDAEITAAMKR